MSKEKHTYIIKNPLIKIATYERVRAGIIEDGESIIKEVSVGDAVNRFETENYKFDFVYPSGDQIRGRKSDYVYIERSLKDNPELTLIVLGNILNVPHELPPKERLFWI